MLTIDLITCYFEFQNLSFVLHQRNVSISHCLPKCTFGRRMTQRIPARGANNNKFYSILKIVPGFPLFGFLSGVKKCLHIVKVYCNNCIVWSVGRNGKVSAKHVKNLPKPSGLEQLRSPFGDEICRKSINHYNSNLT